VVEEHLASKCEAKRKKSVWGMCSFLAVHISLMRTEIEVIDIIEGTVA
jgi:hypothetical protein